ncbi:MAG TPA: flagellar filament capping protein FliD [Lacisediminihabitans sp.]|uniref:flagellar filament capping protein FliD n=1 Tax=Lacisediminihabitans sp. TaxID=2787631 RepID=UPI002ED98E54
MAISLDGLSSGLDTTALITTLMQAEAQPQTLLKAQVTSTTAEIAALQGLNTKLASLADLATSTAKKGALDLYAATSSSTALTATAAAGASAGELQVVVSALAQRQVGVSAAMATWPSPSTLTIVGHDGTPVEISPASSSLDDVVSAINAAGAGVTATKVASGTDASGTKLYRLQLSSTTTGAASSFTVYQGSAADVAAGTAVDVLAAPGSAIIKTAQDAKLTLWAGSSAEQEITSSSNTFTDLLPGVSVSVTATSTDPITVAVGRDVQQVSAVASKLVDALNQVFSTITSQSAVATTTAADGTTSVTAGVFSGDTTVRDINDKVINAASAPIDGHSPSEYGISITSSGTLTFDADKFAAALAADPATVNAALQTIASRVADVATTASDKYVGTLTGKITGDQSQVTRLNQQVADWDIRLASRKATLEKTYSSMEVTLSNLKAQQANLTSQLAALTTSTESS